MRGRILKRYPTYSTPRPHPLHTHGEALNRYEKTNMVLGLNSIDNTSPSLIGTINTAPPPRLVVVVEKKLHN